MITTSMTETPQPYTPYTVYRLYFTQILPSS
nr:MAG TPA: hypothetical protein [Caudoviricetes sp.]